MFGLPGDGINGIMEGLRRHQDRLRFVLVHHEESAAFMATGYAKSTGRLGVCLATSGPGGLHLINVARSFLKGTPRRATIASTLFRDRIDQLKG